jgi:hypothetical protein
MIVKNGFSDYNGNYAFCARLAASLIKETGPNLEQKTSREASDVSLRAMPYLCAVLAAGYSVHICLHFVS